MLEGSSRITKRIVMAGTRKEREVPGWAARGPARHGNEEADVGGGGGGGACRGGPDPRRDTGRSVGGPGGWGGDASERGPPRPGPSRDRRPRSRSPPPAIATVAVKARVDSEIAAVHFRDGALVREGDLLFTLDSRTLEAQVRQVEGLLAGAKANLEQAERDVARYTELLAKNATTLVTLQ